MNRQPAHHCPTCAYYFLEVERLRRERDALEEQCKQLQQALERLRVMGEPVGYLALKKEPTP